MQSISILYTSTYYPRLDRYVHLRLSSGENSQVQRNWRALKANPVDITAKASRPGVPSSWLFLQGVISIYRRRAKGNRKTKGCLSARFPRAGPGGGEYDGFLLLLLLLAACTATAWPWPLRLSPGYSARICIEQTENMRTDRSVSTVDGWTYHGVYGSWTVEPVNDLTFSKNSRLSVGGGRMNG